MGRVLPNKGQPGPVTCGSGNIHPIGSRDKVCRMWKSACDQYQFQYPFQDLDGDERSFFTIDCVWMLTKKLQWPSTFHGKNFWMATKDFSLPSVRSAWLWKTFRNHPNPASDTETEADYKHLWIHGMSGTSNLPEGEALLSEGVVVRYRRTDQSRLHAA